MMTLVDELYPTFRWFLFDGSRRYAAPVTVFGPKRAALYLGQLYLVLTSAEHVRTLSRHFDSLIRDADVQPTSMGNHLLGSATFDAVNDGPPSAGAPARAEGAGAPAVPKLPRGAPAVPNRVIRRRCGRPRRWSAGRAEPASTSERIGSSMRPRLAALAQLPVPVSSFE